ncbi:ATP-binding protein [Pseudomonadales bacterium]|nr:ATP-binding protein [Pseudomonadales bacterium]
MPPPPSLNPSAPNDVAQAKAQANARAQTEGLQATFELFNRMSDNLADSYRTLETQVAALTDELDRVNRQRAIEVKTREQVTSRLSNLLDLLPGGVIVLDRWGAVAQANPAAQELLEREVVGRKWVEVIAECFAPRKDDWHEISLKNGKRVSLATRSLEAETGQIILLTDQTETRRLQQQVSRNERLSALGKMVSALAHQIRTPLSAALLYAGHLSERELSVEQTQRFSEKIVSRLNNLEQQVSDMLIFASGDVRLSDSVAVSDLLQEVQHAADIELSANQITLKIEPSHASSKIICNRQTMIGALGNLIHNSAQASNIGSSITLTTQVSERELTLIIRDTGSGIADDIMTRLQAEEAFVTTKAQGTGLGLAVVRAVVKAHQGTFALQSKEGQGTTVTIVLPCFS